MIKRSDLSPRVLWNKAVARIDARYLVTLALLLVVLLSASYGIAGVVQGLDVMFLGGIGGLAFVITALFAWSAVSAVRAWFWIVVLGLTVLLVRVGRLGMPLWSAGREAVIFIGAGVRYLFETARFLLRVTDVQAAVPPAYQPFFEACGALGGAAFTLLARTWAWGIALLQAEPLYDPVAISLVWGLLFWAVVAWAVWLVFRRHSPLIAVVPTGMVLAWTLSYAWGKPYTLWILMGAAMMLMALIHHDARELRWEASNIDFSQDIRVELLGIVALITACLMTLSVIAPSLSVENIADVVRRLTEPRRGDTESMAESLGLEQRPGAARSDGIEQARTGGLPRRHLIGTGPELERNVVMVIETGELPPMPDAVLAEVPPNHYWRSTAYDIYSGRGWYVGGAATEEYGPGEPCRTPSASFHRPLRQTVTSVGETGNLVYVSGILVTTDQDYKVAWRTSGDFFAATLEADVYRADSLVPVVSETMLREAGGSYPPWIQKRYLDLPDVVPERVFALARDLTATEPTPYDRAVALERYLRDTYTYTLDVSMPPYDRDLADYFLFDLKEGYCDYYATAMAVLARAAGLPARLVVGYATGTYDAQQARYVVTEADAHAWVEIYFPAYGWITFEPTVGQPALDRDTSLESIIWPEPEASLRPPRTSAGKIVLAWGRVFLGAVAVGGLVILAAAQIDLLCLRTQPPAAVVTLLYKRAFDRLETVGVGLHPGDTPYECAQAFSAWMKANSPGHRGRHWGLPAVTELRALVDVYVQACYAGVALNADDRAEVLRQWRRLRWRFWLLWFWSPADNLQRSALGKLWRARVSGRRKRRRATSNDWARPKRASELPSPPPRF